MTFLLPDRHWTANHDAVHCAMHAKIIASQSQWTAELWPAGDGQHARSSSRAIGPAGAGANADGLSAPPLSLPPRTTTVTVRYALCAISAGREASSARRRPPSAQIPRSVMAGPTRPSTTERTHTNPLDSLLYSARPRLDLELFTSPLPSPSCTTRTPIGRSTHSFNPDSCLPAAVRRRSPLSTAAAADSRDPVHPSVASRHSKHQIALAD